MATPYSDIWGLFTNKVTDFTFSSLAQADLEVILTKYMTSAIAKFTDCEQDLTNRDDTDDETHDPTFNITLTGLEQEILVSLMMIEWIDGKLKRSDLLKQSLSSKDLKTYSAANLIEELRKVRQDEQDYVDKLIIDYTYKGKDISVELA